MLGNATEKGSCESGSSMRSHDDHVDIVLSDEVHQPMVSRGRTLPYLAFGIDPLEVFLQMGS